MLKIIGFYTSLMQISDIEIPKFKKIIQFCIILHRIKEIKIGFYTIQYVIFGSKT